MAIELTEQDLQDSLTYLANFGAMVVDGKATAGGLRATARWLSKRKGQKIYHKSLADKLQARFGEQYRQALCNRGVAPILKEYINSNELPEHARDKIADWVEENRDRIAEFDRQNPDQSLDTAKQEKNTLGQHNYALTEEAQNFLLETGGRNVTFDCSQVGEHRCPHCGSKDTIKAGSNHGRKRRQCKSCGKKWTRFGTIGHRRRINEDGLRDLINSLEAGENTVQAAASAGVSQATASRYRKLLRSC